MMTSFQLHKERKKEKAFSEKDKAGYRGQRCRCVCIRGVGLLLRFLHLVQIELQMHLLCILDIQQPLPINHFVSSYILSSVFHLTCQGPFIAKFSSVGLTATPFFLSLFLKRPKSESRSECSSKSLSQLRCLSTRSTFGRGSSSTTDRALGEDRVAVRNQQLSRSLLQVEPLFCFC